MVFYSFCCPVSCMLPELSEIRERRKQLNLTQLQLAELSKVSQSLIAKIENQTAVPSYANAKKLFDTLEKTSVLHEVKAQDVMQTRVFALDAQDSLQKAIKTMEKNGISQLPVLENGQVIGTVSEKGLLKRIENGYSKEQLAQTPIREVLERGLAQIPPETPFKAVAGLLETSPAVLVTENGKTRGIISKSDLLKSVLDKKITKHNRLI